MKRPKTRFTVRRLMISVVVVGIATGAITLVRRSEVFRDRATTHELSASFLLGAMQNAEAQELAGIPQIEPEIFPSAMRLARLVAYHEKMWIKYERAARYPWLLVEPDPPVPR